MSSPAGRRPELLQAGLRRGVVHQRVHVGADLPVGTMGPHHQLENGSVPAPLRRHRRGDPGCLVTMVTSRLPVTEAAQTDGFI